MSPRDMQPVRRREDRIPMEIPVVLDGHRLVPGTESTFTENVSTKGARVSQRPPVGKGFTGRVRFGTGEFRSAARVAYCQPIRGDGFAIGVEFLETKGRWVVESTN